MAAPLRVHLAAPTLRAHWRGAGAGTRTACTQLDVPWLVQRISYDLHTSLL